MVYCVGLTGDIASGKTTAAAFFSKLGVEVFHADKIAKLLTQKHQPAYDHIVQHFGVQILNKDKELNRSKLREIIFSNQDERAWLEKLLHPQIHEELKKWVDACSSAYCIVEIPLLITKCTYPYINKILLIRAPLTLNLSRVMRRDHCSKEQAHSILSIQPDRELRLATADDVIDNTKGLDELAEAVKQLHHKYLHESKRYNSNLDIRNNTS